MPTALIVDDKSENRYLLECLLAANGFKVIAASNGREALDRAEANVPDLVLSDILMPVMDGFTLCRQWKQSARFKSIPFVFYTATYTDPKDEQFALSLGADMFIVKPTEPDELVGVVQSVLAKRTAGRLQSRNGSTTDDTPYLRQYNEVLVRKLEDKLQEVEKANQHLMIKEFAIASANAGIAMANLDGSITYGNAAFAKLWGIPAETVAEHDLSLLFPVAEERDRVVEQLNTTRHWAGPITRRAPGNTQLVVIVEMHVVLNSLGVALCHMITCSDITEQERMRLELQHTQRLESLSHFAAGIAHDFNNLLTVMFAGLNLAELESGSQAPETPQAYVLSAFTRARGLTQRLLNFGKGGNLQRRHLRLEALVEESCQLALSGSGTTLKLQIGPALSNVYANATEMSQVFCNLIINARQAMNDSGVLQITAENCALTGTSQTDPAAGDYVRLLFRDEGPGIQPELLTRIFEPYFTSKEEGSGLGLAMCHAIVTNHGGKISVNSTPGAGANFEILLPASDQAPESIAPAAPKHESGSGNILWMDDNEQLCRLTAMLLAKQGYSVTSAFTGEQAIARYTEAQSSEQPFDLVVLDLTVQGGLGGFETLARLREIDPTVVALACSGYADDETLLSVMKAGFRGLIAKPFLAHELYNTVQAAIGTKGHAPPSSATIL